MFAQPGFPLFPRLPIEVRLQIWQDALPGPRIVYLQRHIKPGKAQDVRFEWPKNIIPRDTYFASPTPNCQIISLLSTCQASRHAVRKNYALIVPGSSVWFSYSNDFLYLDWGNKRDAVFYSASHLTMSFSQQLPVCSECYVRNLQHPKINEHLASRVQNLAINGSPEDVTGGLGDKETFIARDVMSSFPNVKLLVMADQMHDSSEAEEELVWIRGDIGNELSEAAVKEEHDMARLRHSILWRDPQQYNFSGKIKQERIERRWSKYRGTTAMPKIIRRSIITSTLKQSLLAICREESLWKLSDLNWPFVTGVAEHHGRPRLDLEPPVYMGDLSISQQIGFLELALRRVSDNLRTNAWDSEDETVCSYDAVELLSKIEKLDVKKGFQDIALAEAEQMMWR